MSSGSTTSSNSPGPAAPAGWFAAGASLAGAGVILGAFGAHGLESRVAPEMLAIWETGVRYHMYHALALVAVGLARGIWTGSPKRTRATTLAGWFFVLGIAIFSGSLYALTLTGIPWLGAITPIGGVFLIAGWAVLAWSFGRFGDR